MIGIRRMWAGILPGQGRHGEVAAAVVATDHVDAEPYKPHGDVVHMVGRLPLAVDLSEDLFVKGLLRVAGIDAENGAAHAQDATPTPVDAGDDEPGAAPVLRGTTCP